MSPLIPQRSFKLDWDLSLKLRSQKTKPLLSPACSSTSFAVFCQSPALSSRSESCQYFSLSSKRAPLLTYSSPLPPLYAVLTFKGLVWPRAPQCHALGPEMPSPSLSYILSLSNSLFLLARLGQHNQLSRALPGQWKMDFVSSLSMAMLTLAKRGQQKLGRFGRYHFTNLG